MNDEKACDMNQRPYLLTYTAILIVRHGGQVPGLRDAHIVHNFVRSCFRRSPLFESGDAWVERRG